MATLNEIEGLTKSYASARQQLGEKVHQMKDELTVIERKYLAMIKRTVAVVKTYEAELKAAIEKSPEQFKTPKTRILYGIKVGFRKQKGSLDWADDEIVIKLIKKHFPEMEDVLIKKTEKPAKDGLASLSAQELKKLGVELKETGDAVVVEPTDSEVDKLVKALLKEKEEEAREAA